MSRHFWLLLHCLCCQSSVFPSFYLLCNSFCWKTNLVIRWFFELVMFLFLHLFIAIVYSYLLWVNNCPQYIFWWSQQFPITIGLVRISPQSRALFSRFSSLQYLVSVLTLALLLFSLFSFLHFPVSVFILVFLLVSHFLFPHSFFE